MPIFSSLPIISLLLLTLKASVRRTALALGNSPEPAGSECGASTSDQYSFRPLSQYCSASLRNPYGECRPTIHFHERPVRRRRFQRHVSFWKHAVTTCLGYLL